MRTSTFTLQQGTGKTSGKPYTALKLSVGKWSTLHFPSTFELEYLTEYFKTNQTGTISLNQPAQSLVLIAGDYEHNYRVDSILEYRYIVKFLSDDDTVPAPTEPSDNTLDLNTEDAPGEFKL